MKVQDIMTRKVASVSPATNLKTAAKKMKDFNVGTVLVTEAGELLGIITDRDIGVYAISMDYDPQSTQVQDVMTHEVYNCPEDMHIDEAASIMEQHHIRRLAVMGRDNTITGILSVDDLAQVSCELAGSILESATPVH